MESTHTFSEWIWFNGDAVVVLVSVLVAALAYRSQNKLARQRHSIEFQNSFHDERHSHLKNTRHAIAALERLSADEVAKRTLDPPAGDKDIPAIREALNTWERAAIGIRDGIYDEHSLFTSYATSVSDLWALARPYVQARQLHNKRLYAHFDWLAVRWRAALKKRDRDKALEPVRAAAIHRCLRVTVGRTIETKMGQCALQPQDLAGVLKRDEQWVRAVLAGQADSLTLDELCALAQALNVNVSLDLRPTLRSE